ncbi:MAG: Trk system potassium transporter TrkA, partial [Acholeplasmatales bacterium]|nr:Trk system potassium transporter TrkA [Acholeplasmatales bacterium]
FKAGVFMKIVIVGAGKIGSAIVKHVSEENHEVIVIDDDPKVIEEIVNQYDVLGISGNGVSYEMQKEAGVANADIFIAVTTSDEANMLACLIAKKLGAKHTIARVRDYEYTKQIDLMTGALEITRTINPEHEASKEIMRIINFPEALKVDSFAHGNCDLTELFIPEDSPLVGQSLMSMASKIGFKVLVCAVQRGNEVIIPKGQFVFEAKDKIHLISSQEASRGFISKLGLQSAKLKDIMIIGAGKITTYLADALIKNKFNVKIIEINPDKAKELAELLPNATVVLGDGSDQNLLREEGILNSDAVICLTGIDEENIIISLYANKLNVKKIITKVNRASFQGLLESIEMGSVISPKDLAANQIVSYIRATSNARGNNVLTLHKIVDNQVEAIEFLVTDSSKVLNIPLKDLELRKDILIAGIIRNHQVIIPSGMTSIEKGDSVIVVSKEVLSDLDEILV